MMRSLFFFFITLIAPLYSQERVCYLAEVPANIEANFQIGMIQQAQGHEIGSTLAGCLQASIFLEKKGVSKGEEIKEIPDFVVFKVKKWEGVSSSGGQTITYSSDLELKEEKKIFSPYQQAAATLLEVPIRVSVKMDGEVGMLRFEDEGNLALLVSRNPIVAEICPIAMLESILQQTLAPACFLEEQWQRLASTVSIPVKHDWTQRDSSLILEAVGDFSRAKVNLKRPLEGTFSGKGSWNPRNGLFFRSEQSVEYTAHLESREDEHLHVEANWLIQGKG